MTILRVMLFPSYPEVGESKLHPDKHLSSNERGPGTSPITDQYSVSAAAVTKVFNGSKSR